MESQDELSKIPPQEEIDNEPQNTEPDRTVSHVGDLSTCAKVLRKSGKEKYKKKPSPFRFR